MSYRITILLTFCFSLILSSLQPAFAQSRPSITVNQPSICAGSSVTLTANPSTSTPELVVNGSFSNGTSGYGSDYCYNPSSGSSGNYTLALPSSGWSWAVNCNWGAALYADGSCYANQRVWYQTITVKPNTNYRFSYKAASIINGCYVPCLAIRVNGCQIANAVSLSSSACVSRSISAIFNSGSNTSVQIAIVNLTTYSSYNDFVIDNVSCKENINNTGLTYSWNTGQTGQSISVNPTTSTTYTVYATNSSGGCTSATSYVTVNPSPTVTINSTSSNICAGQSVTLNANANSVNELICNGTFSNGNTCFGSDYCYNPNSGSAGNYTLVLPSSGWSWATNCGWGAALYVDGACYSNKRFWYQTVTVRPNTAYRFTFRTANIVSGSPTPCLALLVNGCQVGNNVGVTGSACAAQNASIIFNSGNHTSLTLALIDWTTSANYNDFVIDDISCKENVSNTNLSYLWSNGATTSAISVSPTTTTTYSVTVTNSNGCSSTLSSTVNVSNVAVNLTPTANTSCNSNDFVCQAVNYSGENRIVYLFDFPQDGMNTPFRFNNNYGQLVKMSDGTAHLTGQVFSMDNSANGWYIDVWFKDKKNWSNWSALGRGWKGNASVVGDNYQTWDYYIMDSTKQSKLTGFGIFNGSTFTLTHNPTNYYYGLQVGTAANDKDNTNGFSFWFGYSGNYNGKFYCTHGDMNASLGDCTPTCNGLIDANVSNGTAPFSYQWSNGATGATLSNLCAGTYSVNVTDANGCTATASSEITTQNCCVNVTNPGLIGYHETGCGPDFDPAKIVNVIAPSGGQGALEFVWIYTTDPATAAGLDNQFEMLPNSDALEYDPAPISQTTWFRRCVRRSGCVNYTGESNWVRKEVIQLDASMIPTVLVPAKVCSGDGVMVMVDNVAPAGTTYTWNFGSDANVQVAYGAAPSDVFYSTLGEKNISVLVNFPGGCSQVIYGTTFIAECSKAIIGDFVWEDNNNDGLQSEGERGIPNVTVQLLSQGGDVVQTDTTDICGHYLFFNVELGTYRLSFSQPDGRVFTQKKVLSGGVEDSDSDVNPETGYTDFFTVEAYTAMMSFDAGLYTVSANRLAIHGNMQNDDARLTWNATEALKGCRFELHRSIDGLAYERVEVPMQKAEGKRQTYKVFDYGANLLQNKEVFYRVRVIDAEGKSFWSVNTVTLEPNLKTAAIDCNTYPNPVKQTLFVEYNFGLGISKAKVTLVNAVGQVVYETEATADGNEQTLTIPVNDLPVGMYSLQLSNGSESITKKIIVSK